MQPLSTEDASGRMLTASFLPKYLLDEATATENPETAQNGPKIDEEFRLKLVHISVAISAEIGPESL